jgi:hypothetical protein
MDKPSLSHEHSSTLKGLVGKKSPLRGEHWCFCKRKSNARRVSEGAYLVFGFPGLRSPRPTTDDSFANFAEGTYRSYSAERAKVSSLDENVAEFCRQFATDTKESLPLPAWSTLLFSSHEPFEAAAIRTYQSFNCQYVRLLCDPLGTAADDLGIPLWKYRARMLYPWFALAIKDDVIIHAWTEFKDTRSFLAEISETLNH